MLENWKNCFKKLLNTDNDHLQADFALMSWEYPVLTDTTSLNEPITIHEIRFAMATTGKGKALGCDDIPLVVLQSEQCSRYLLTLFNCCFSTGNIPEIWSRRVFNLILKDPNSDSSNPLNYRDITITSAAYKLFCSILHSRLSNQLELNNGICEEQIGFRVGRSTDDHLSSLLLIVESRIKRKLNTFAVFIDFSKAYDGINRDLMWHKLSVLGVSGKC